MPPIRRSLGAVLALSVAAVAFAAYRSVGAGGRGGLALKEGPAPGVTASSQLPRFEEITKRAGITFRHNRASSGRRYFVETMGAGVAVIDYDADGKPDLFFVNGAPLPGYRAAGPLYPALYHNLGNGRFEDVTRKSGLAAQMYGMGCAVGDYDNDGFDDLYLTSVLGPSHLFHNQGDGTFSEVTSRAGVGNGNRFGSSAAWLDYNKDGRLDLFVANYVKYASVADDLPCFFKEHVRSYCIPFAYTAERNCLYRNDGNGHFTDVTAEAGLLKDSGKSLAVGVADYNGDGWPDLFVANDTTPTQLYRNNGDGTFTELAATMGIAYGPMGSAKAGMGVDVADDRNDGELAVAMGNFSGEMVGYYRLSTAGYFDEQSLVSGLGHPSRSFLTFGTLFLDVENDGWKDLFLLNGHVQDNVEQFYDDTSYRQRALLYRNLRNGHYEEIGGQIGAPFNTRMVGRSAARVDLDGDGRLDLVLTENNGPAHLWRNVTPGGNHWLGIRLEGAESNRDGYGAQVTAIAGGLRQRAELESGSSYLSASDRQLHFGLGSVSRVDRLEVRWPSGRVDHFSNIDADRVVRLREGETSLHPAQPTNSVEGLHTKPAA